MKIDFVIPFVDPQDKSYRKRYENIMHFSSNPERYRSWDNLAYLFRGIETFAPWVNNVYLITDRQIPSWLNTRHEKLKIVDHKDFIPKEFLPTFNSNTIEMNLHRIQGLSEFFVLFNDDHFILDTINPDDFFRRNRPVDRLGLDIDFGQYSYDISHIEANNILVLNDFFDKREMMKHNWLEWYSVYDIKLFLKTLLLSPWKKFTGFNNDHLPNSFLKSKFNEVWEYIPDILENNCLHNKKRSKTDVNQWLVKYWQMAQGLTLNRKRILGKSFNIDESNILDVINEIEKKNYRVVCFNDNENLKKFHHVKQEVNYFLESRLSVKSKYEK